jgi:hypothetical protein
MRQAASHACTRVQILVSIHINSQSEHTVLTRFKVVQLVLFQQNAGMSGFETLLISRSLFHPAVPARSVFSSCLRDARYVDRSD